MTTIRTPHHARRQHGRINHPFTLILIVALVAGLGFWLGQRYFDTTSVGAQTTAQTLQSVLRYPQPKSVGPAILRTAEEAELPLESLRGRWTLVFFGFTHCPDVCPTTLARLAEAAKHWASLPSAQQPQVLFVSVDPERDSGKITSDYARYFNPEFIGATADDEILQTLASQLGMVYMKSPVAGGGPDEYTMDHSSSIVLLDPQLRRAGLIRPPLDPAAIGSDLTLLVTSDNGAEQP